MLFVESAHTYNSHKEARTLDMLGNPEVEVDKKQAVNSSIFVAVFL